MGAGVLLLLEYQFVNPVTRSLIHCLSDWVLYPVSSKQLIMTSPASLANCSSSSSSSEPSSWGCLLAALSCCHQSCAPSDICVSNTDDSLSFGEGKSQLGGIALHTSIQGSSAIRCLRHQGCQRGEEGGPSGGPSSRAIVHLATPQWWRFFGAILAEIIFCDHPSEVEAWGGEVYIAQSDCMHTE